MKKILFILFIVLILLNGCVSKTPEEVLHEYINLTPAETIDERIISYENQLSLTSGDQKERLSMRKDFYEQWISFAEEWMKKGDKTILISEVSILSEEKTCPDSKTCVFDVKLKRKYMDGEIKVINIKYILKNDGGWKIDDSEVEGEEKETIPELKKAYGEAIENLKRLNKDECGHLSFNDKLSATELMNEQQICYNGKYIKPAIESKDSSKCDSISNTYYYASCVGAVAKEIDNPDICENVREGSYTARGLSGEVNTKDVCYLTYVDFGGKGNVCSLISHSDIKTKCVEAYEYN